MASYFDEIRLVTKVLDNSVNWCAFKVNLEMTFTREFLSTLTEIRTRTSGLSKREPLY